MQEMTRSDEPVVNSILDRIKNTARVEVVYGESREMHGKTIVPVAYVAYMFGGGEGGGVGPTGHGNGREGAGSGSGGGGAVRVMPVGVLEVTDEETRLVPVIDWTRIITTFVSLFGAWMIFRQIFRRRR